MKWSTIPPRFVVVGLPNSPHYQGTHQPPLSSEQMLAYFLLATGAAHIFSEPQKEKRGFLTIQFPNNTTVEIEQSEPSKKNARTLLSLLQTHMGESLDGWLSENIYKALNTKSAAELVSTLIDPILA